MRINHGRGKIAPLLGVCPLGKFAFSHADAVRQKKIIFRKLDQWGVRYCDLDRVLPDGLVRDQKHAGPVVDYFRRRQIDALFLPHCNFGTEGAAGLIARQLNVPVLVWGPRDEAPLADGSRLRDSLCGMLATTGVLYKLGIPFSYIENCRPDDPPFKTELERFIGAAAVVKAMRRMRIGQVGTRIDFFWSTIINEKELLEQFGIQVHPVDMAELIARVKILAQKDRRRLEKEMKSLKTWIAFEGLKSDQPLLYTLALRDELRRLAAEEELDALAIQSFSSLPNAFGGCTGLAESFLADEGIPTAAETDIHGAIAQVILKAAALGRALPFFPEFTIRHPQNDNAVLLWHATAPFSLKDPAAQVKVAPPWILKGLPSSFPSFKLKDGPLTVCSFERGREGYLLGCGQGQTVPGPHTNEFYAWLEVDHWPTWERKLIEGPYIHHCSAIFEHCADVLAEACKFIPGLKIQRFENEAVERGAL